MIFNFKLYDMHVLYMVKSRYVVGSVPTVEGLVSGDY